MYEISNVTKYWVTRLMQLVEQELLSLPVHPNSPLIIIVWFYSFSFSSFSVVLCILNLSFHFVSHGIVCLQPSRCLSATLVSLNFLIWKIYKKFTIRPLAKYISIHYSICHSD